jgi:helicase
VTLLRIDELNQYKVSESVITKLNEYGFETLTSAQEAAIKAGLFEGKNLLINAPTNTGKTFIGELAALNASQRLNRKRSFFLVPLKALADQMFQEFTKKYGSWGIKVAISTSDHYEFDADLNRFDIVVSTYEKINGLIIKQPEVTQGIGLIVVDEIQHVGDDTRGVALEMLLTRLRVFSPDIQIIGLSATVSNARSLADWLGCTLVEITKRDVELREGILYTGTEPIDFRKIQLEKGDFIYKEYNSSNIAVERKLDLNLIDKIIEQCKTEPCLFFTSTPARSEEVAQQIAKKMPVLPEMDDIISELGLLVESTPITAALKKVLVKGIAFHHAGLLGEERRIIEENFRKGKIRLICCTSTLAAGINTPAKNVIILFQQYYGGVSISVSTYKNISGRAGRFRGNNEFGRSMLLAENQRDLEYAWDNYVNAKPERIVSQITKKSGLDRSILGLITTKTCPTRDDLNICLGLTFFGHQYAIDMPTSYKALVTTRIDGEIDRLKKMGLITENGKIETTELGTRCAEELVAPETALTLYNALRANETKINKLTDYENIIEGIIHLCCSTIDANLLYPTKFKSEIQELDALWAARASSYLYRPTDRDSFLRSMRTTRMLLRWIEGANYVDLKQYAPPGVISRIADNIQWIAKGLTRISEKPLFAFSENFSDFLYELSERVAFGVPKEAVTLMGLRIKGIHRRRALNLVNAGFCSVDSLLDAKIEELKEVEDIGETIALRIKESVEYFIDNETKRKKSTHIRAATKLGKDVSLIIGLYEKPGDELTKHIVHILTNEFGINATFVGTKDEHEPDIIIPTAEGKIVIELKRRQRGKVSVIESEEIYGKAAKYKPIALVTIGYPDFVDVAKQNATSANITLISVPIFAEMLIEYWNGTIDSQSILTALKQGKYIYQLELECLKKE